MTPKGIKIFNRKPGEMPAIDWDAEQHMDAPAPASKLPDPTGEPMTMAQRMAKADREAKAAQVATKAKLSQVPGEFDGAEGDIPAPQAQAKGKPAKSPQANGKPDPSQGEGQGENGSQDGSQDAPDHFTEAVRVVLAKDAMASEHWVEHQLAVNLEAAENMVKHETEAVKAQVEQIVKQHADGPRFVQIQVNDLPPVILDGDVDAHPLLTDVVRRGQARIDVALVGPTGCGKTYLLTQAAKAVGLRFGSISWSAGVTEAAILGRRLPSKDGSFEFVSTMFLDFFENGGWWLNDEFDSADANVVLNLNSAQANGFLPVPNRTENPIAFRHKDFVMSAALNTYGQGADRLYVGRNQLDAATLDRYACNILDMDYDEKLEQKLVCKEVFVKFAGARAKARANKIRRPISTRAMVNAHKLVSIGFTLPEVWSRFTAGWTADELTKIGG